MRLHLFFFFFEFRSDSAVSAVSADTGRYGSSRPNFGRIGADFRRIGANFSRVSPIRDLPRGTTRSDTAGRGRPCVRAATDRVVPRGKSRIGPTRLKSVPIRRKSAPMRLKSMPIRRKSAPTRPKSSRLDPYRPVSADTAESGRNSKKKKKVQTHRFTNLKTPRPLTFRPTLSNSLSHSVPHLPSLCHCAPSLIYLLCVSGSLCECSVLLQPSSVLSLLL